VAGPRTGSVQFLDALPLAPVRLGVEILTPHIGDWLVTKEPAASPSADWIDPTPIPFLTMSRGARLAFPLLANPVAPLTLKEAQEPARVVAGR
jgi:CRISPR-associated protein Cmr6